jgi:hypothetical protein
MSTPQSTKTTRNIRALFALGFIMALVASIGGGLILALGYSRASVTQPMWKFGHYVLILGSLNLAVYLGLWWQVRALRRQTGA